MSFQTMRARRSQSQGRDERWASPAQMARNPWKAAVSVAGLTEIVSRKVPNKVV